MAAQRPHPEVDWEAIEQTPAFQELVTRRRSFVLPATIFFLTYYMAFILLCGYAPDFMGSSLYQGLTVGYGLALTQFVMVAVLGVMYLKRADREFDPLAERVLREAGVHATDDGEIRVDDDALAARDPESEPAKERAS